MIIFAAIVLLISAVFNIVVWPQFWRRVVADPRAADESGRHTRFYTVHAVLFSFSILLAACSLAASLALFIG